MPARWRDAPGSAFAKLAGSIGRITGPRPRMALPIDEHVKTGNARKWLVGVVLERLQRNQADARCRAGALVEPRAWRGGRDVARVRPARHARPAVGRAPALALVVPDVPLAPGVAAVLGRA